jgi:hypothetical protein
MADFEGGMASALPLHPTAPLIVHQSYCHQHKLVMLMLIVNADTDC